MDSAPDLSQDVVATQREADHGGAIVFRKAKYGLQAGARGVVVAEGGSCWVMKVLMQDGSNGPAVPLRKVDAGSVYEWESGEPPVGLPVDLPKKKAHEPRPTLAADSERVGEVEFMKAKYGMQRGDRRVVYTSGIGGAWWVLATVNEIRPGKPQKVDLSKKDDGVVYKLVPGSSEPERAVWPC